MTRLVLPIALLASLVLADLALGQAGSGSGSFGGGGGGGGGGFSGGGGGFSGGGGAGGGSSLVGLIFFFGFIGVIVLLVLVQSARYRIKLGRRTARVRTASAEAAADDAYFAAADVEREADALFNDAQQAWDAVDRERLKRLVGGDLLVEWTRRLDDFEKKGWHNRVRVLEPPLIQYVGITNREEDEEDRVVVRISASLQSYVQDEHGHKVLRTGESDEKIELTEYWTLARRDTRWIVTSIEQKAEGDHHLESEIVASPWSGQRIADETITELAVEDKLPEGFTTADLADFVFEHDARARALDLALADGRFAPDVLEAAARRAVAAWAEAVDGEDAPLERISSPEAIQQLLYGSDTSRKTRLVVRGPRVQQIRIAAIDVERQPATMTIEVALGGRRYVEDRDTTTVVSGSKDSATTFTERWTLALDGPDDAPWRIVDTSRG